MKFFHVSSFLLIAAVCVNLQLVKTAGGAGPQVAQSGSPGKGGQGTQSGNTGQGGQGTQSGNTGQGGQGTQSGNTGQGGQGTQSGNPGKGGQGTQSGNPGKGGQGTQSGNTGKGGQGTQSANPGKGTQGTQSGNTPTANSWTAKLSKTCQASVNAIFPNLNTKPSCDDYKKNKSKLGVCSKKDLTTIDDATCFGPRAAASAFVVALLCVFAKVFGH